MNALADEVVGVVWETMQPARVSVWLHPDSGVNRCGGELRC